jgi:hypothetical protein
MLAGTRATVTVGILFGRLSNIEHPCSKRERFADLGIMGSCLRHTTPSVRGLSVPTLGPFLSNLEDPGVP